MEKSEQELIKESLDQERYEVLQQFEDWLEWPVLILGFVWLLLVFIEFLWGLNPFLESIINLIWGIFVLDFCLRMLLAPNKWNYLKSNWLGALSLFVPALRIFRIARLARFLSLARTTRGLRLLKLIGSINRGMSALRASIGRSGFGYVALLTLLITLLGAAGMLVFEDQNPGFQTYGDSLFWTAMMMTTLGSEFWPRSPEGRLLGFLLALYAFAVFGYVTATLATFFVGREVTHEKSPPSASLQEEIRSLREELHSLRQALDSSASSQQEAK